MASVARDPGGRMRVVYTNLQGKRVPLRLGVCSLQVAREVATHVQKIINHQRLGERELPKKTAEWLLGTSVEFQRRLVQQGLLDSIVGGEARDASFYRLDSFLREFIDGRTDIKPRTQNRLHNTRAKLVSYFGEDRDIRTVTAAEAEDFRAWLLAGDRNAKLKAQSPATVGKIIKNCRLFWTRAIKAKRTAENPFQDVKADAQKNSARKEFVPREVIDAVLKVCPDTEWRLIIALSRFGGLRCPSEHLRLQWEDINWADGKMLVHSEKTEGHEGKGARWVPLFPELVPFLQAAWNEAEEAAAGEPGAFPKFVINRTRDTGANWRTQFLRLIKRAGQKKWERLFHNLRASRATELAAQFPRHVVAEWLGHSEEIAETHYLQTVAGDFLRAANEPTGMMPAWDESAAQNAAREIGNPPSNTLEPIIREGEEESQFQAIPSLSTTYSIGIDNPIPPRGVEQVAGNPGNSRLLVESGTESGAPMPKSGAPGVAVDPGLARVAAAWKGLSTGQRSAILRIITGARFA